MPIDTCPIVHFQKKGKHWHGHWATTPGCTVNELLVRIVDELAPRQAGFLERGFTAMAPLTMQEVATSVGCLVGSVSRLVAKVQAVTPLGRMPLKSLFSLKKTGIIAKIAELLANEDAENRLSDPKIAKIMRRQGIKVSRRSIAKYRKVLNNPSTHDPERIVRRK